MATTIEPLILSCPFDRPVRHWRFDEDGIISTVDESRRKRAYFMPIAQPKKITTEWEEADTREARTKIEATELLDQIDLPDSIERTVAESLLNGASTFGAEIELGDASARARIYNANSGRPATLFGVARRKTFYARSSAAGSKQPLLVQSSQRATLRNSRRSSDAIPHRERETLSGSKPFRWLRATAKNATSLTKPDGVLAILRDALVAERGAEV